jgi:hypothetical protein
MVPNSCPLGGDTFGNSRHFHSQISAARNASCDRIATNAAVTKWRPIPKVSPPDGQLQEPKCTVIGFAKELKLRCVIYHA